MRVQAERDNKKSTANKKADSPKLIYTGLLREDLINIIHSIFRDLDKYGDKIVERDLLVQSLKNNSKIKLSNLMPAVYLPSIKKSLNLGRVVKQIEQDGRAKIEGKNKDEGKFLSWDEYLQYFGCERPYQNELERRMNQEKMKRDIMER